MKITPQNEQYGLPPKEARELPSLSEVSEFLGGLHTIPGLMKRQTADEED